MRKRLGAPSTERRAAARSALGLDAEAPVLISVGRHEHPKGYVHLLRAISALRDSIPGVVLLLAGRTGHATEELTDVHSALALDGTVRMLGHRNDVPELLSAADVRVSLVV